MKKIICLIFLVVLATNFLLGCGHEGESQEATAKGGFVVKDIRGKTLNLSKKPEAIAGGYIFADEIVLDLVPHHRICGLTKWIHDEGLSSSYEEARDVKGVVENNLESVLALRPDLVLVPEHYKKEYILSLEDAGLNVFVYHSPTSLENIPRTVLEIGHAVGEEAKAQDLVKDMEARLSKIRDKTDAMQQSQRKSGLIFLRFGAIGGEGSIYNDVLSAAGIRDSYMQARQGKLKPGQSRILGKEEVVKANPDFLIMGSWTQGGAYKATDAQLEDIYNDASLKTVNAIKQRQAVIVPQSYVNCLSHRVVHGIEKLHTIVYEAK